jgi:hypothetical protein
MERPITAERGWGSNDVRANRNRCIFSAGAVGARIQQTSYHRICLQAKPNARQRVAALSTRKRSRCNHCNASAMSSDGTRAAAAKRTGGDWGVGLAVVGC